MSMHYGVDGLHQEPLNTFLVTVNIIREGFRYQKLPPVISGLKCLRSMRDLGWLGNQSFLCFGSVSCTFALNAGQENLLHIHS